MLMIGERIIQKEIVCMSYSVWESVRGCDAIDTATMFMKHNMEITQEIKRLNENLEELLKLMQNDNLPTQKK